MATPSLPVKPASVSKRLAIVSFFGGVGIAFAAALIFTFLGWYESRPKVPKPWNPRAMVASYDNLDTVGKDNHVVFYYVVENTTDLDYRVTNGNGMNLVSKLEEQKSLSPSENEIRIEYPFFFPAKNRVQFCIETEFPYSKRLPTEASVEERRKWRKELEQFVKTEWANLNGFVLFDENSRYEIDFPKGW